MNELYYDDNREKPLASGRQREKVASALPRERAWHSGWLSVSVVNDGTERHGRLNAASDLAVVVRRVAVVGQPVSAIRSKTDRKG